MVFLIVYFLNKLLELAAINEVYFVIYIYTTQRAESRHTMTDGSVEEHIVAGLNLGSDYFTENFQLKENKTRMRNIHPRFFHLLF